MDLKLNVYGKDKKGNRGIVKTYIAKDYEIEYGVLEDLLEIMEAYTNKSSEQELTKIVLNAIKNIKPLMMDIFNGLTEEELRHVKTSELIMVVVQIMQYGLGGLTAIGGKPKN